MERHKKSNKKELLYGGKTKNTISVFGGGVPIDILLEVGKRKMKGGGVSISSGEGWRRFVVMCDNFSFPLNVFPPLKKSLRIASGNFEASLFFLGGLLFLIYCSGFELLIRYGFQMK